MGYADGLVLSPLTDKVEWSRFNPVAYLFAAAMLAPFIWIARKRLYYRPAKLKAMQAKYETMGEYRKLLGQCLFWLYITGSFASFFIIAEQKNHSKEQPLIERLQEIRDGKYPVENILTDRRMTFFRLPPCLLSHAVLRVEPAQPFCFSRPNIRAYGAKSESAAQGHTVTDAKHRKGACCRQFCNFV